MVQKVKPYSFALPPQLKRDIANAARADGVKESTLVRNAVMKDLSARPQKVETAPPTMARCKTPAPRTSAPSSTPGLSQPYRQLGDKAKP